jgi:putative PIG3 family NAD(P)H quinone oxidoreductase
MCNQSYSAFAILLFACAAFSRTVQSVDCATRIDSCDDPNCYPSTTFPMATMRAVIARDKSIESLEVSTTVPKPVLKDGHYILVRVAATSVNRLDTLQRKGLAPVPAGASEIMGVEAAGTVAEIGAKVTMWQPGDRVMCLLTGGGYAEYVAVNEAHCLPVPENMSITYAAAVCEVFLTAYQAMRLNGNVQRGDHVLIHAGASGVGTAACQLCRHVLHAKSVTTSSAGKIEHCKQFADYAVSREKDESTGKLFASKVLEAIGGPKINLVIDPVFGGGYLEEDAEVLALDGKVVVIAFMGGATIPDFNATPLFRKRAEIKFSTLRSQPSEYKRALVEAFREEAYPALVSGKLSPVIQHVLPVEEIQRAHTLVETNATMGKVVLTF